MARIRSDCARPVEPRDTVSKLDTRTESVWIVSDVHLDADPDNAARARSDAFARFLLRILHVHGSQPDTGDRLVILGDLMNLPSTNLGDACKTVERIARVHEKVFAALTGLVSGGLELVVVPGNHDIELILPEVFSTFHRHIVPTPEQLGRVRLVPWIYYIPDLLYAEHGNQHHDINWFSTLLTPTYADDDKRLQRTTVRWLEGVRRPDEAHRSRLRPRIMHLAGLANSLRSHPGWAMPREDYVSSFVVPYGASIGIGGVAARSLDAATIRGPVSVFRRLTRRTARRLGERLWGMGTPDTSGSRERYMRRAVPEIVTITRAHGAGVPFYVFGHTHVARHSAVDDDATYLNAGTWSGQLPDDRASDPELWLTFLRITGSSAELMRWDDTLQDWRTLGT